MSLDVQLALLLWGTLVGLDLVSVPQMMIARPLVAATVAGLILGDVETGLRLGVLFELFYSHARVAGSTSYFWNAMGQVILGACIGSLTALVQAVCSFVRPW